ncbi:ABC transporter substrate-binding protein [uncultured Roseibium sp.]|uniref:ABC transporter substrate-binding protein n=1 Tax=uncultured Roseibium sp. TaxID=1936171 RepID=UPI002626A9E4|nr:ABC transporter substrate-binding protein [uncultured Roseibium sp.]
MTDLNLSIAVGDYDRMRPLFNGDIKIDGVDPVFLRLSPEEIFFRAFRHADFDVCELSLSSFAVKTANGDCPYVGIPVFPSRAFRHTSIYVRKDRGIESPADLKGKRIGLPEYQLTANVWARALMEDEFGVAPRDVEWIRAGIEEPGRPEKIKLNLPSDVKLSDAPDGSTLSGLLRSGDIDAMIGPRIPSCFGEANRVGWAFEDPRAAAMDYYRRTKIFPIMHIVGIRRDLAEAHPWLAATLVKAFSAAKSLCAERLSDTSATKVMLPFVEEQVHETRKLMGDDYWSYGLNANRHVLETFLHHHHAQGLSSRKVDPEELFDPSTFESAVI